MDPTVKDVVVNGVRSPVRETGPSTAREAVVFVHGAPGSGEDWADLLPRAGEFTRAIAPDMPGFGKADRPRAFEYTVNAYARHLGGVLDQLGIERAHLVLHDWAGPWGLAWIGAHPKAAASVTLMNIGIMLGHRAHKFMRIVQAPVLGELFMLTGTAAGFRWAMNRENPRPLPREFLDRVAGELDWGTKRASLKLARSTPDLGAMHRALAERMAPLKLPALVVWGAGDKLLPARYAEEQRRFFGETDVHVLEGCGHWPHIDEPERVAQLVIPFLRRQLRREAGTRPGTR